MGLLARSLLSSISPISITLKSELAYCPGMGCVEMSTVVFVDITPSVLPAKWSSSECRRDDGVVRPRPRKSTRRVRACVRGPSMVVVVPQNMPPPPCFHPRVSKPKSFFGGGAREKIWRKASVLDVPGNVVDLRALGASSHRA
jgi:hypothetical protein